jgi:hypothetical protein
MQHVLTCVNVVGALKEDRMGSYGHIIREMKTVAQGILFFLKGRYTDL